MNYSTDNTRIIDRRKVPAPYELVNEYLLLLGPVQYMIQKVQLSMQKNYQMKLRNLMRIY